MDSPHSLKTQSGRTSAFPSKSARQKRPLDGAERRLSVEMDEALQSLDGPARPVVTSDEEDENQQKARFKPSVPADRTTDDESTDNDEDTASDQETGHNSSNENDVDDDGVRTRTFPLVTANNPSPVTSPRFPVSSTTTPEPEPAEHRDVSDWDNDERSNASTFVPLNRSRNSTSSGAGDRLDDDEKYANSDDYDRTERFYTNDDQQQCRLAQQQRYGRNYTPPRNIYDAALRLDYSNNYGEQSFMSYGDDGDETHFSQEVGGLNLGYSDADERNDDVEMPIDESNNADGDKRRESDVLLDVQERLVSFDDDHAFLNTSRDAGLPDADESVASKTHVPVRGELSSEERMLNPDVMMPVVSEPLAADDSETNEFSSTAAVEKTDGFSAEQPETVSVVPRNEEKHEWIDIFGTGDLLKKTLSVDASTTSHTASENINVRPPHRSLCLISYVGYIQQPVGNSQVDTDVYDNDEIAPEKAVVFTKAEQPKRVVVGEADDIPAIDIVLRMMRKNEKVRAITRPRFAYGVSGNSQLGVSGTNVLIFDIKLVDIISMTAPETTDEYCDKPDKLLSLSKQKKEAGNCWFGMHMSISAATAWQAGICYADAALAAMPTYLLNTSDTAEVARDHLDKLREQISALKSILYSNMSLAQMNEHSYDMCLRSCDEALKLNRDSIKCLVRKGKVLGLLGKHQEAVDTLREAKSKVDTLQTNNSGAATSSAAVASAEDKLKWRKEIDELFVHSSLKVKKETKQEAELFKRMLGGLSPKADRKPKTKNAAKTSRQLQKSRNAAVLKHDGDVTSSSSGGGGGAFRNFFNNYRNVIVAGSFVAVTFGVIASAYFLKRK